MIKGVNKKIIEIKNPDSIYFERAVFYLKPHIRELPEEVAEDEALHYISMLVPRRQKHELTRSRLFRIALFAAAAAVIAAIVIL